ncbi:hypothetical protein BCR37DRAFT_379132 [Protomyces lactucae-debilis]|uniref:P-loop containing nucleoside triphosphate hydrolase protein n=1 Tax=Protomyces lactucae-debilis TaxID=2754530 RepID=A0A1Y2FGT2_PROLT|nr:uncharacterized protein BCR37DRAFT_379132 [Protomyces lactucae-debilis]ORY83151.1 hypothetical protein BCR37DRAFT_379132 [Protomyces lactucae-debilis]
MSTRYSEEECKNSGQHDKTFNNIYQEILAASKDEKYVFVKDMSQYIVKPDSIEGKNPTVFTDDELKSMTHSFLIRTPEKSVPSYYRCCSGDQAKETGFETYDPDEAGYRESVTLFKYLTSIGIEPIIVDSSDLIKTPKLVMQAYCKHVGIPYLEGMIEWKAEKVESFDKWKGFHDDAQQSTGFKEVKREKETHPEIVTKTIEENKAPYEWLFERRVKIDSQ